MRKCFLLFTSIVLLGAFCSPDIFGQANPEGLFIFPGGKFIVETGAGFSTPSGIRLAKGSTLQVDGTLNFANTAKAYWTDSMDVVGSLQGNGTVVFQGRDSAILQGASRFFNLKINGALIMLDSLSSVKVRGQLTLQKGIVLTGNSNLTILNNSIDAIVSIPENQNFSRSFIAGSLRRAITENAGDYVFPVGDRNTVQAVHFFPKKMEPTSIVASYTNSVAPRNINFSADGLHYAGFAGTGKWKLEVENIQENAEFDLQLALDKSPNLTDNLFGIVERKEFSANAAWSVSPGSSLPLRGMPGRMLADGFARRNRLTNLSNTEYSIATGAIALPVSLLSFNAIRIKPGLVEIKWKTDNEKNSKGFYVERSLNGINNFSAISFLPSTNSLASGNQIRNYRYEDPIDNNRNLFYRLKQVDLDGNSNLSGTIAVKAEQMRVSVSPNPSSGLLNIETPGYQKLKLLLYNAEGRLIVLKNFSHFTVVRLDAVVNGTYTLELIDEKGSRIYYSQVLIHK